MENEERTVGISSYPPAIEPTVDALELEDAAAGGWVHWPRVSLAQIVAAGITVPTVPHWFGQTALLADCDQLIGYKLNGILSHYAMRAEHEWMVHPLPEEVTGQAALSPSVRLVFRHRRALDAFVLYLRQVSEGQVANPTLTLLLDQLACIPVVCDVGTPKS